MMITIRKLLSLKEKTRIRKIIKILREFEFTLSSGKSIDLVYIKQILGILERDKKIFDVKSSSSLRLAIDNINNISDESCSELLRNCNSLRHHLLKYTGEEPGEWDFFKSDPVKAKNGGRKTFPFKVFLEDIRSPFNVGSIFRTAEAFGVEKIFLSQDTPLPSHNRVRRSAMGCTEVVPWEIKKLKDVSDKKGLFALELGGTPITSFNFPEEGILILGSEELGISPEARTLAETRNGVVTIPMRGQKASLNVGVAFGILINAWTARYK